MEDNFDQQDNEQLPPLPKGYQAVKTEITPPLPNGYEPLKKNKNSQSVGSTSSGILPVSANGGVSTPQSQSQLPSVNPDSFLGDAINGNGQHPNAAPIALPQKPQFDISRNIYSEEQARKAEDVSGMNDKAKKAHVERTNEMVNNTVDRIQKAKGVPIENIDRNSIEYRTNVALTKAKVDRGELVETKDKYGNLALTRPGKFGESAANAFTESFKAPVKAWDINKAALQSTVLGNKDLIDLLDKRIGETPEVPEYQPNKAGEMLGGAVKPVGVGMIPYVGLAAITAETGWTSYANQLQALYQKGIGEGLSKEEAIEKAKTFAPLNASVDAAGMYVMGKMGAKAPVVAAEAKALTKFKQAIVATAQSAGKVGTLMGTGEVLKSGGEKLAGYDVTMDEVVDKFFTGVKDGVVMDVAFKVAHGIIPVSKYVKSLAKDYLSKLPKDAVAEELAKIPEGAEIHQKLDEYEAGKAKVEGLVPQDQEAFFAGLETKKAKLQTTIKEKLDVINNGSKSEALTNVEIEGLKKEVVDIDAQMVEALKTGKMEEVNPDTGEKVEITENGIIVDNTVPTPLKSTTVIMPKPIEPIAQVDNSEFEKGDQVTLPNGKKGEISEIKDGKARVVIKSWNGDRPAETRDLGWHDLADIEGEAKPIEKTKEQVEAQGRVNDFVNGLAEANPELHKIATDDPIAALDQLIDHHKGQLKGTSPATKAYSENAIAKFEALKKDYELANNKVEKVSVPSEDKVVGSGVVDNPALEIVDESKRVSDNVSENLFNETKEGIGKKMTDLKSRINEAIKKGINKWGSKKEEQAYYDGSQSEKMIDVPNLKHSDIRSQDGTIVKKENGDYELKPNPDYDLKYAADLKELDNLKTDIQTLHELNELHGKDYSYEDNNKLQKRLGSLVFSFGKGSEAAKTRDAFEAHKIMEHLKSEGINVDVDKIISTYKDADASEGQIQKFKNNAAEITEIVNNKGIKKQETSKQENTQKQLQKPKSESLLSKQPEANETQTTQKPIIKPNEGSQTSNEPITPKDSSTPNAKVGEVEPTASKTKTSQSLRDKAKAVREKGYNEAFGLPSIKLEEGTQSAGYGGKALDNAIAKSLEIVADGIDAGKELFDSAKEGFEHLKDYYAKNSNRFDEDKLRDDFIKGVTENKQEADKLREQFSKQDNGGNGKPPIEEPKGEDGSSAVTSGSSHNSLVKLAERLGLPMPERGEVLTNEEYTQRGQVLLKNGADPIKIADDFEKTGLVNAETVSVAKAHLAELEKIADKAKSDFGIRSEQFKKAKKDVYDWSSNTMKPMGTKWAEIGRTLQGETDLDTGSYISLARAVEDKTGKPLTTEQHEIVEKLSTRVKLLDNQVKELTKKLSDVVDKAIQEEKNKPVINKKAEAAKRTADAMKAFRRASGLSSGGLESLPEFIEVIKAFINEGLVNAKDIIDRIRQEFPKLNISDDAIAAKVKEAKTTDIRERFADKKGNNFSLDEVKAIWDYAKSDYLDSGADYREMLKGVSVDLGLTTEQVRSAISQPKSARVITDEMYRIQKNRNDAINQSKQYVETVNNSKAKSFFKAIPNFFFALKTAGHGTVGAITHAGMNLFQPSTWKIYFPYFIKQFQHAFGGLTKNGLAKYEKAMEDLELHPKFTFWQRAGLAVEPKKSYGEYDGLQKFFGKLSEIGNRGFNALKPYRLELAEHFYNKLSNSEKADPNSAKEIAKLVNHSTGTTEVNVPSWTSTAFFAPKLEISRWQGLITDPAKAVSTFTSWNKSTLAEKAMAKRVAKNAGEKMATYMALLAANSAILSLAGSKNSINYTDPTKSDWLKFKIGDKTIDFTGGVESTMRFIGDLLHEGYLAYTGDRKTLREKPQDKDYKTIGQQLRYKLSPFMSTVVDVGTGTDAMGRPLPYSKVKPKKGEERYSVGSYLLHQQTPIPISEGVKETVNSMKQNGMSNAQVKDILMGILVGTISGGTGVKVGDVPKKK